jgi:hypothetical protein
MQPLQQQLKQSITAVLFCALGSVCNVANAESDMQIQERVLKAREMLHQQNMDHSEHAGHPPKVDKSLEFHGVFYGYLPCKGCDGIKTTLSLKQNDNYLMVIQPAKASSREAFDKGKYVWDEERRVATLTSRKDGQVRYFRIEDEGTLYQMNKDGSPIASGDQSEYALRRSDTVKSREVHIH